LTPEELQGLDERGLPDGFSLQTVYERYYPHPDLFAHIAGYVGEDIPDQHGKLAAVEHLFPPVKGRAGMEKALDRELRGVPGEISRLYDEDGVRRNEELGAPPRPGPTAVLSINFAMQKLAAEALARSGRPGAFVAVDADTGDILAMVSYPSYDTNLFVPGISHEKFQELASAPEAPFFDRAVTGTYPPASTFKSIVAMAGLDRGIIWGLDTLYTGPPSVFIAGRPFKNWHGGHEGSLDVRMAITRSCNTWFYQAGLEIGSRNIIEMARRLGYGTAPDIPLDAVAEGFVPDAKTSSDGRSVANLSIGQGALLASPLQVALAMGGLANGDYLPKPRLVTEWRDPRDGYAIRCVPPVRERSLGLDDSDVRIVHEGMWGATNYHRGTGGAASMGENPRVYGKTGTAQWAVDGRLRSLAWYTGWVDAPSPRIAFAAVSHGREGETLGGGRHAAPIAAQFLKTAFSEPETYAVVLPAQPSTPVPELVAAVGASDFLPIFEVEVIQTNRRPLFRRGSVGNGGLLRALFGRRKRN